MEYRGGILIANSDLYHHGILGQKWGKRNGPPYPLGSSAHSSAEKKAGWRKSLKNSGSKKHTGVIRDVTTITTHPFKAYKIQAKALADEIRKEINKKSEDKAAKKKQREFNKKPLEEREKIWKEENKKYYTENKDRMLKNAKDNDQYDMEFLERTSDEWSSKTKKDKLKDYEKYLDKMAMDGKAEDRYGSIFNNKKSKDKAAKQNADRIVQERLDQKEADEFFEKNKEKILKSGKAKDALAVQSRLSNTELQAVADRLRLNATLADYADKQNPKLMSNWDKIDKAMDKVDLMTKWTKSGIEAWNVMAKMYNVTPQGQKERLPIIGEGGGNKKK